MIGMQVCWLLGVGILQVVGAPATPAPPRECSTPYPNSAGADGICVESIAGTFGKPRMMAVEKVGGRTAILVVDAVESTVVHLMDVNGDGKIEGADERKVLVQTDQHDVVKKLSHGIAIVGDYVFATSAHQLYRWEYNRGARELSNQVTLVDGISDHPLSEGGSEETKWGHVTRTLAANADTMFISVGSAFNVDANEFRSALRKVPLATLLQPASAFATPLQFIDLALVANGLRNEVGLAFDSAGVLWGVENGADNAYHKELGGDVHNDNPSEEVNKFDITKERLFYGYPYCWSEFRLPDAARATYGHQPGRQWVWERTLDSADAGFADTHNDTFCRDSSKVVAPHYSFQAHMAPLGITFLKDECGLSRDAFPCAWRGKAFVAFHGSWNRNPAVGYKVVMLDMESKTEVDIFTSATAAAGGAAPFVQGTRPVDVQFDPVSGVMYLTQDGIRGQGEVLVVRYIGDALTVAPATPSPHTIAPPTPAPETVAPPTIAPATPAPPRECTTPYSNSAAPYGICVESIAGNFGKPRMMAVEKVGGRTAILVVDAVESTVVHLMDVNGDGKIEGADERKVLVQTDQHDVVKKLSHGIAIVGDYVFATSAHQLYRWEYNRGARELSNQVTLVDGISDHPLSEGGSEETKWGHVTRTLAVNADTMFISVGSAFNVDANEFRSALRKVPLATLLQPASAFATPLQFIDLALVANGLRNEVGLAFDSAGVLWGVENGADNLYHEELGGDVHNDNPSEEVNKFDITKEGLFYGYPYCWSEFRLPEAQQEKHGHQPGRQWVWERTVANPIPGFKDTHNNTFCRDPSKVVAPHYSFQAHMAPLGITFLKDECGLSRDAFPCAWRGKAFVAFHGSWNRNPAVGYKVVMLDMEAKTEVDIFTSATAAAGGSATFPDWAVRPVDVQFDPVSGVMYLTQDAQQNRQTGHGEVLVLRYLGDAPTVAPATPSPPTIAPPTPTPSVAPDTQAPVTHIPDVTAAPVTPAPTPASTVVSGVFRDAVCTQFLGNTPLVESLRSILSSLLGTVDPAFSCGSVHFTLRVTSGAAVDAGNLIALLNQRISTAGGELLAVLGEADLVTVASGAVQCPLAGAADSVLLGGVCVALTCSTGFNLATRNDTPVCVALPTPAPSNDDDLSGGVIAAIVVGSVVAVAAVAVVAVLAIRRRYHNGKKPCQDEHVKAPDAV